jgi:hypothetical protein
VASPTRPRLDSPVEPAPAAGLGTPWGGLAYLLATAAAAEIPDAAFADTELGAMPGPWILFHLGQLLVTAADDDPAVRALGGLQPRGPRPRPVPTPTQRIRLTMHADRWARVTTERLGDTGAAPRAVVRRLAARAGTVDAVPGWIEIGLRLADVDLAVRRAGLDLDPGFVPWLGAVVVIRYG